MLCPNVQLEVQLKDYYTSKINLESIGVIFYLSSDIYLKKLRFLNNFKKCRGAGERNLDLGRIWNMI